jgi:hypothetical protein
MNTPGLASIERKAARWNRAIADGYLSVAAVGILGGIALTFARTPVHLPGHKVIWWMAPVLASCLATRARFGASVGALTTAMTTFSLGGRLGGGVVMMPLVVLAGVVLDVAVRFGERRKLSIGRQILLLGAAGIVGNLICLVKRLADPMGAFFSAGNLGDLGIAAGSYSLFGFVAGLLGAGAGHGLRILHGRR